MPVHIATAEPPDDDALVCEWCGKTFRRPSHYGPRPRYCSVAHRQEANRVRNQVQGAVEAVGPIDTTALLGEEYRIAMSEVTRNLLPKIPLVDLTGFMQPLLDATQFAQPLRDAMQAAMPKLPSVGLSLPVLDEFMTATTRQLSESLPGLVPPTLDTDFTNFVQRAVDALNTSGWTDQMVGTIREVSAEAGIDTPTILTTEDVEAAEAVVEKDLGLGPDTDANAYGALILYGVALAITWSLLSRLGSATPEAVAFTWRAFGAATGTSGLSEASLAYFVAGVVEWVLKRLTGGEGDDSAAT